MYDTNGTLEYFWLFLYYALKPEEWSVVKELIISG